MSESLAKLEGNIVRTSDWGGSSDVPGGTERGLQQECCCERGRSHVLFKTLCDHLQSSPVDTVIDVDLANFYGTIDHKIQLVFLRQKIGDECLQHYLARMFKAGGQADFWDEAAAAKPWKKRKRVARLRAKLRPVTIWIKQVRSQH